MSLENLLATISLAILALEGEIKQSNKDETEKTASDASPLAWLVAGWGVLGAEDKTARNTTDTTESNKSGTAERTLPLSANVVGLEGHDSGDVGVGTGCDEEDAK